jgi:RNA polymerase sigma factor (sigma-70 family)
MYRSVTETDLLRASQTGNRDAFGQIVERYQPLICAITYSATGDITKSQELAQETFLRAWAGLGQIRELDKFRIWLCRVARNVINRSIRKDRYDVVKTAQSLDDLSCVESPHPQPSELAINREQEAMVWRALESIPPDYREPLVLFYRQQQSVKQVASDMGLSEEAVKQRLSRGRQMLKAEVAGMVEDVIGRSGPKKAFAVAVVAALPALAPQAASAAVAAVAAKGSPAAKAVFATGLAGAVLGPLLGLLGGVIGTWASISNTNSARERRFMIRMSILFWLSLLLMIGLPFVLALTGMIPKWCYWMPFALFFVLLIPAIVLGNRRQRQIQIEEGTYVAQMAPPTSPKPMSKGAIYGSFAGATFGAIAWILPTAAMAKDWLCAALVLIGAGFVFAVSTRMCLNNQKRRWQILLANLIGLAVLNLAVVNLRWHQWMQVYRQSPLRDPMNDIPIWMVNLLILVIVAVLGTLLWRLRQRAWAN